MKLLLPMEKKLLYCYQENLNMFWIIVSFFAGVMFAISVITFFVIYQMSKSAEEAHKQGFENPFL
jgi:hypothetical protein